MRKGVNSGRKLGISFNMIFKPILTINIFMLLTSVAAISAENTVTLTLIQIQELYKQPKSQWPKPTIDSGVEWKELESASSIDSNLKKSPLVHLGKRLFHEPRLSESEDISCTSCHRPNQAFAENSSVSTGHKGLKGSRNAPSLVGIRHASSLFWDGRSATLEEQALGPIANPVEMAMPIHMLSSKLKTLNGYEKESKALFGTPNLTTEHISYAIAAYERTLEIPRTRFDQFVDGNRSALKDNELFGLHLFRTKGRCMNCHNGEYFSDNKFHNLGLTYYGRKYHDVGRYNATTEKEDIGRFRTPTLRAISQTGPYMHNGLFRTLRGVLNMYNGGMFHPKPTSAQTNDPLFPNTSPLIKKLDLTKEELEALNSFLEIL